MRFNWEKSNRSIVVTDLPAKVCGVTAADSLTLSVKYEDGPSARNGATLDNAVMPLIAAAPELLSALRLAVAALRGNGIDESMAGEFEILEDAIARAEGGREWIIRSSADVDDETGKPLEWSNASGWVGPGDGDIFHYRSGLSLPVGGEWHEAN